MAAHNEPRFQKINYVFFLVGGFQPSVYRLVGQTQEPRSQNLNLAKVRANRYTSRVAHGSLKSSPDSQSGAFV